jgi:hypothetical protein
LSLIATPFYLTKLEGKGKKKPCKLQLHQKIKKLKILIKNNLKRKKKKENTTLTKKPQSRTWKYTVRTVQFGR